jgi:hypothetical protein
VQNALGHVPVAVDAADLLEPVFRGE